jgi:hypothetical protein
MAVWTMVRKVSSSSQAGRDDEHGVDETVEPVAALDDLSDAVLDLAQELAQSQLRQRVAQGTGAAPRLRSVGHGTIVAPVRTGGDGSA